MILLCTEDHDEIRRLRKALEGVSDGYLLILKEARAARAEVVALRAEVAALKDALPKTRARAKTAATGTDGAA